MAGKDNKEDKSDPSKWVQSFLGDVSASSATQQIAIGAVSGWVTGYATMKVGKLVAVAVGGSIIVLQIANHKGYIKIDWDRIIKQANKVTDQIEKEATGKGPGVVEKLERFVDRKLDKAEELLNKNHKKARGWFDSFLNNGNSRGYELQELHIFLLSFAAGVAIGIGSG